MIIGLFGSRRFQPWYEMWTEALTDSRHIIFGSQAYKNYDTNYSILEKKNILDKLSLYKIQKCDIIFVLNVFAYIGDDTLEEINNSILLDKEIIFLESWAQGNGIKIHLHNKQYVDVAEKYKVFNKYSPIDTFGFMSPYNLLPPDDFMYDYKYSIESSNSIIYEKNRSDILNKLNNYQEKIFEEDLNNHITNCFPVSTF